MSQKRELPPDAHILSRAGRMPAGLKFVSFWGKKNLSKSAASAQRMPSSLVAVNLSGKPGQQMVHGRFLHGHTRERLVVAGTVNGRSLGGGTEDRRVAGEGDRVGHSFPARGKKRPLAGKEKNKANNLSDNFPTYYPISEQTATNARAAGAGHRGSLGHRPQEPSCFFYCGRVFRPGEPNTLRGHPNFE